MTVDRRVKTYQSDLSLEKTWAFWGSSLTFSISLEETLQGLDMKRILTAAALFSVFSAWEFIIYWA